MSQLALDRSMRTADKFGRMRVEMTNISKANVCPYMGREIPNYQALGLDAAKTYLLWRHPDELAKAAPTFDMVPILDEHVVVDAANPEKESVAGCTGTGTRFEFPYLKVPMALWVGDAIDGVKGQKKRQLSCGYGYRADMTPGVTPDGVAYDGVMRDIMANHVALVREGRAGPDVMVADEALPEIFILALDASNMKRSAIIAALASFFRPDADQVALDAALDVQVKAAEDAAACTAAQKAAATAEKEAQDAHPEDWEDDPEKPGTKRKKKAKAPGMDATMISKADADKLAKDAADKAVADALAAQASLIAARTDVADVVGAVALDSAEAVYRFALEQEKVADAKTIHVTALPAVWAQVKARKTAVAQDSATGTKAPTTADAKAAIAAIGL